MKKIKEKYVIFNNGRGIGGGQVAKGKIQNSFSFCHECQLGDVLPKKKKKKIMSVRENQKEGK